MAVYSAMLSEEARKLLQEPISRPEFFKAKVIPYWINSEGSTQFLLSREVQRGTLTNLNMLGGSCNENETIFECARRELFEETIGILDIDFTNHDPSLILSYERHYRHFFKGIVYVFFLPISPENAKDILPEFEYRRGIIDRLYNPTPLSYQDYSNIARFIGAKTGHSITKHSIKHFHEIAQLAWISEQDLIMSKEVNRFLRSYLNHVRLVSEPAGIVEFSEYARRFLLCKKIPVFE